jgi:hypothetical protein
MVLNDFLFMVTALRLCLRGKIAPIITIAIIGEKLKRGKNVGTGQWLAGER